jgi:histone H3/H4
MKTLREIKRLQRLIDLIISRLFFAKIVRDVLYDIFFNDTYQIQLKILKALQKTTKSMITTKFQSKFCVISLKCALIEEQMFNLCVIHAKRVILQIKNMRLMKTLREIMTKNENSH